VLIVYSLYPDSSNIIPHRFRVLARSKMGTAMAFVLNGEGTVGSNERVGWVAMFFGDRLFSLDLW